MDEELSTTLTEPEAVEVSTQLDPGKPTSEGQPHKEEEGEKAKPESRLEAIKRAAEDVEKAKPEVKDEAPAEKKVEEEPAKAEEKQEAKPEVKTEPKAERRTPIEPPAKFLPRAKELWVNVPHEVRSEVSRALTEAEQEMTAARESAKEYESIRPYAEMAKQSGTTIDQALGRYVQMEQTLRSDPTNGFKSLLQNMGIGPQEAVGHILAAFNVTPERLAQHIAQDPNAYTALAPRQPQQQVSQSDNEIERLRNEMAQLKQGMAQQQMMASVVEPFARENPRFYELQDKIAGFLKSDMIPRNLSEYDRLEAAYDMAVRISPSVKPASDPAQEPDGRAGEDFGGNKSVRGAPASGVDTTNRRKGKVSRSEAINAAMSELGIAH